MAKHAQIKKMPRFTYEYVNGVHIYSFPDAPDTEVSITIEDPQVDPFKRLHATLTGHVGNLHINPCRYNLLDPQKLVDFASVAATLAPAITWHPYLMVIVPHLRTIMATEAQDLANVPPDLPTMTPVIVTMSDVEAEAVDWLWYPYIARKKIAILDGDPGVGKTLLITQISSSLSRGNPLPDQQGKPTLPTHGSHTTLLLSAEDGLADTLKPRLQAAGADTTKVHVLTGWCMSDHTEDIRQFTLQHMPVLEAALERYHPALVVIDPIQAYLGDIDMHRANETRPLLARLTRLAEQYNCAIVCIRHPAKPGQGGGKVIHRGLGSVDFIGAARTGLYVEQHPADPGKVLFAQSKSNIGPLGRTQVFTKHEGRFEWCGVSRLTAEMIAGSGRGPDPQTFLEAICWLEDALRHGIPKPSSTLQSDAEEEGLSWRTLQRAKKALGVRSAKTAAGWDWILPPFNSVPYPPLQQPGALGSLSSLGTLGALGSLEQNSVVTENNGQECQPRQESQETQECQERHIVSRDQTPVVNGNGRREQIDRLWDQEKIPRECPKCGARDFDVTKSGEVLCIPCSEKELS